MSYVPSRAGHETFVRAGNCLNSDATTNPGKTRWGLDTRHGLTGFLLPSSHCSLHTVVRPGRELAQLAGFKSDQVRIYSQALIPVNVEESSEKSEMMSIRNGLILQAAQLRFYAEALTLMEEHVGTLLQKMPPHVIDSKEIVRDFYSQPLIALEGTPSKLWTCSARGPFRTANAATMVAEDLLLTLKLSLSRLLTAHSDDSDTNGAYRRVGRGAGQARFTQNLSWIEQIARYAVRSCDPRHKAREGLEVKNERRTIKVARLRVKKILPILLESASCRNSQCFYSFSVVGFSYSIHQQGAVTDD